MNPTAAHFEEVTEGNSVRPTMDSSRTQLLLSLILLLSGSDGEYFYETVGEGEDVTLFCEHVTAAQSPCENTDWLFGRNSRNTVLFSQGQKYEDVPSALSLSENCSLGLKSVTEEQAGEYYCQQFIGSRAESTDTNFILSVVKLSQERKDDRVTVSCSVSTPGQCVHTLKWLNNDTEVDKDQAELQTSHSVCWASVSFTARSPSQFFQSLKCEVKDVFSEKKVTLIPRPADDKRTTPTSASVGRSKETNTELYSDQTGADLLRPVVVSVGLAALLISVAAVVIGTRTKGINTERSQHNVHREDLTAVYECVGEPSVAVRFNQTHCPLENNSHSRPGPLLM